MLQNKLKVTPSALLGDAAAWPIQGLIKNFKPELLKKYNQKRKAS